MAYTKEERREYNKKYHLKNKEAILQQQKGYYEKNRKVILQKRKEYEKTEKGRKSRRIHRWKNLGMVCDDWESVYQIYIHTWHCEFCLTEFTDTTDRHLDHCHKTLEVRAILCRSCNVKDVLK